MKNIFLKVDGVLCLYRNYKKLCKLFCTNSSVKQIKLDCRRVESIINDVGSCYLNSST